MNTSYITIDGGTTNTRIRLIRNNKIIDKISINAGAKSNIDKKKIFEITISENITTILNRNKLKESNILAVISCGMITSEYGLYEVMHIMSPAGIYELHQNMVNVTLKNITSIPIYFIPGLKQIGENLESTDMMRGEETELIGIQKQTKYSKKATYILPGSHSKIIHTDSRGKIISFTTMLTGEMIQVLSKYTILKNAVNLELNDINNEYLFKGFSVCDKFGLNQSLFKVRILKSVYHSTDIEVYSFFLGCVLHDEVKNVKLSDYDKIFIGGKSQIRHPLSLLFKEYSTYNIIELSDEITENATNIGMISIFQYK